MAKKREEFKLCPFCGGMAEMRKDDWGHWHVGCFNQSCSIHPLAQLNQFVLKKGGVVCERTMTYLIKDAVKRWNKRNPDIDSKIEVRDKANV